MFLGIQKATLQLYRRNVPLFHTSKYVIACDQFYQSSPELVLQATSADVRRPGYEARITKGLIRMFSNKEENDYPIVQDSQHN